MIKNFSGLSIFTIKNLMLIFPEVMKSELNFTIKKKKHENKFNAIFTK